MTTPTCTGSTRTETEGQRRIVAAPAGQGRLNREYEIKLRQHPVNTAGYNTMHAWSTKETYTPYYLE